MTDNDIRLAAREIESRAFSLSDVFAALFRLEKVQGDALVYKGVKSIAARFLPYCDECNNLLVEHTHPSWCQEEQARQAIIREESATHWKSRCEECNHILEDHEFLRERFVLRCRFCPCEVSA